MILGKSAVSFLHGAPYKAFFLVGFVYFGPLMPLKVAGALHRPLGLSKTSYCMFCSARQNLRLIREECPYKIAPWLPWLPDRVLGDFVGG